MTDPGLVLRTLREMAGLPVEAFASRAGLTVQQVARVEDGQGDEAQLLAYVDCLGIDRVSLAAGELRASEEVAHDTSLFLFHGDVARLRVSDLRWFDVAFRAGRLWSLRPEAEPGLQRRRGLRPAALEGDHARAVAQQGHRLARLARAALGTPGVPFHDVEAVARDGFGVPVCRVTFGGEDVRAGAILMEGRGPASILVERSQPASAMRAAVAHELGHLLFDPEQRGRVRVTAEHLRDVWPGSSPLWESRAKGFAAEFLAPFLGIVGLVGRPQEVADVRVATELVRRVRDHFGVGWELATNQLVNHTFVRRELRAPLLDRSEGQTVEVPPSADPLEGGDGGDGVDLALRAQEAHERRMASALIPFPADLVGEGKPEMRVQEVVDRVAELVDHGRPLDAGAEMSVAVERVALAGDLAVADALMDAVTERVGAWPADVGGSVLVNTAGAKLLLEASRSRLIDAWLARRQEADGWDVGRARRWRGRVE